MPRIALSGVNSSRPVKNAALIIIGDEILTGKVKDENSFIFANAMFNRGVKVGRIEVIPDDILDISKTINNLRSHYDYVCTSGGVGPTHDDKTFLGVAEAFKRPLKEHEEAIEHYLQAQKQAGRGSTITDAQKKMMILPFPCHVYFVESMWLPLVQVENIYIFPGVPFLFEKYLVSLSSLFEGGRFFRRILFTDQQEAAIAQDLGRVQEKYSDVSIGSYPQIPRRTFGVMISIEGTSEEWVKKATEELVPLIEGRLTE